MHLLVRVVIGLILIFAPWAFGTTETWSLRTLEVLCFLNVALMIIQQAVNRDSGMVRWRRPAVFIFGLLVLLFIGLQLLNPVRIKIVSQESVYELVGGNLSLPHTIHWAATKEDGLRWISFSLFGFSLLQSIRTRNDVTFILRLLVLNAVLVSIEGILQSLSGSDELL